MEGSEDNSWTGKGGYSQLNQQMKWDLQQLARAWFEELKVQDKIDFVMDDGKPNPIPFCVKMAFIEGFLNGAKSVKDEVEKINKKSNRIVLYLN